MSEIVPCIIASCVRPTTFVAVDEHGHQWPACDVDRESVETVCGLELS